jgi:hypothetical protein
MTSISNDNLNSMSNETTDSIVSENNKLNAPEDNELNVPEDNELNAPEDNELNAPEDNKLNAPEDNELNAPEDNELNAPEDNGLNVPEDNKLSDDVNNISSNVVYYITFPFRLLINIYYLLVKIINPEKLEQNIQTNNQENVLNDDLNDKLSKDAIAKIDQNYSITCANYNNLEKTIEEKFQLMNNDFARKLESFTNEFHNIKRAGNMNHNLRSDLNHILCETDRETTDKFKKIDQAINITYASYQKLEKTMEENIKTYSDLNVELTNKLESCINAISIIEPGMQRYESDIASLRAEIDNIGEKKSQASDQGNIMVSSISNVELAQKLELCINEINDIRTIVNDKHNKLIEQRSNDKKHTVDTIKNLLDNNHSNYQKYTTEITALKSLIETIQENKQQSVANIDEESKKPDEFQLQVAKRFNNLCTKLTDANNRLESNFNDFVTMRGHTKNAISQVTVMTKNLDAGLRKIAETDSSNFNKITSQLQLNEQQHKELAHRLNVLGDTVKSNMNMPDKIRNEIKEYNINVQALINTSKNDYKALLIAHAKQQDVLNELFTDRITENSDRLTKISKLNDEVIALRAMLTAVSGPYSAMESRLNACIKKFNELDDAFGVIESNFGNARKRLDNLESNKSPSNSNKKSHKLANMMKQLSISPPSSGTDYNSSSDEEDSPKQVKKSTAKKHVADSDEEDNKKSKRSTSKKHVADFDEEGSPKQIKKSTAKKHVADSDEEDNKKSKRSTSKKRESSSYQDNGPKQVKKATAQKKKAATSKSSRR